MPWGPQAAVPAGPTAWPVPSVSEFDEDDQDVIESKGADAGAATAGEEA